MPKVQKQSTTAGITINVDPIKKMASETLGSEIEKTTNSSLVIFNDADFDELAKAVKRAEDLVTKVDDLFAPVTSAIELAKNALDSATGELTSGAKKFVKEAKGQLRTYLENNPNAKPNCGAMHNGQWKLNVTDEDAVFLYSVKAELVDGTIKLSVNPMTRNIFKVSAADANRLASAMNVNLNIPGCEVERIKALNLTVEKEDN